MTADHFETILQVLRPRRPFRVFTVELNGGRQLEVDYHDALRVRDGIAVFFAPGGAPILFDHESVNRVIDALASADL